MSPFVFNLSVVVYWVIIAMRKGHMISLIKDIGLGKKINKRLKCMPEYLPNELGRTTVNFQRVGSGGTQVKNF